MRVLNWEPPAHNGDDDNVLPLDGYQITQLASTGERSSFTIGGDSTSISLDNDFDGYAWVSAFNAMGTSQASASVRIVWPVADPADVSKPPALTDELADVDTRFGASYSGRGYNVFRVRNPRPSQDFQFDTVYTGYTGGVIGPYRFEVYALDRTSAPQDVATVLAGTLVGTVDEVSVGQSFVRTLGTALDYYVLVSTDATADAFVGTMTVAPVDTLGVPFDQSFAWPAVVTDHDGAAREFRTDTTVPFERWYVYDGDDVGITFAGRLHSSAPQAATVAFEVYIDDSLADPAVAYPSDLAQLNLDYSASASHYGGQITENLGARRYWIHLIVDGDAGATGYLQVTR